jgi:hypothetical protein
MLIDISNPVVFRMPLITSTLGSPGSDREIWKKMARSPPNPLFTNLDTISPNVLPPLFKSRWTETVNILDLEKLEPACERDDIRRGRKADRRGRLVWIWSGDDSMQYPEMNAWEAMFFGMTVKKWKDEGRQGDLGPAAIQEVLMLCDIAEAHASGDLTRLQARDEHQKAGKQESANPSDESLQTLGVRADSSQMNAPESIAEQLSRDMNLRLQALQLEYEQEEAPQASAQSFSKPESSVDTIMTEPVTEQRARAQVRRDPAIAWSQWMPPLPPPTAYHLNQQAVQSHRLQQLLGYPVHPSSLPINFLPEMLRGLVHAMQPFGHNQIQSKKRKREEDSE